MSEPETKPTLEDLRAAHAKAAAELSDAEAEANKPAPIPVADAQANLAATEALLEAAERPYWDREHARFALATANETLLRAPDHLKDAAKAVIPGLEAAHAKAIAAHEAHTEAGVTAAHIDVAAQGVLAARAVLEASLEAADAASDAAEPAQ